MIGATLFIWLTFAFQHGSVLAGMAALGYVIFRNSKRRLIKEVLWSCSFFIASAFLAVSALFCVLGFVARKSEFGVLAFVPAVPVFLVSVVVIPFLWKKRPLPAAAKEAKTTSSLLTTFVLTSLVLVLLPTASGLVLDKLWQKTIIIRTLTSDNVPVAGAVIKGQYVPAHMLGYIPDAQVEAVTDGNGLAYLHVMEPREMRLNVTSPQGETNVDIDRISSGGKDLLIARHHWLFQIDGLPMDNAVNKVMPNEYPAKVVTYVMHKGAFQINELLAEYDQSLLTNPQSLYDPRNQRMPYNAMVFRHDQDLQTVMVPSIFYGRSEVRADYFFAEQAKGDLRQVLDELVRLRGRWGEDEQVLAFVASIENMLGIAGSGNLRDRGNLLIEKISCKLDYYKIAAKEYETVWKK